MRYEILVTPAGRGEFAAHLDGRLLHKSTHQPLLDCARILLKEGADPGAKIEMRHNGADHVALWGVIGMAAKLRVRETTRTGTPSFVPWEAFKRGSEDAAEDC